MKSIYGLGTQQFLKIQADFGLKPNINNISEIMNNIFRYPQKAFEFKPHISQKFIQISFQLDRTISQVVEKLGQKFTCASKGVRY